MTKLEQEISDSIANDIKKEIDEGIFFSILKELGWTQVDLPRLVDNIHALDIIYWLEDNIKNKYRQHGRCYIFEEERDAILFSLRWL